MKPEFLSDITISITPVGSRVTCDPPPTDTDEDWIVYAPGQRMQKAIEAVISDGFKLDNPSEHYRPEEGKFNSWRKGEVNLIITADWDFHRRYLSATEVAKKFNLMKKEDRVMLFQAVLYGNGGPVVPMPLHDFLSTTVQSQGT